MQRAEWEAKSRRAFLSESAVLAGSILLGHSGAQPVSAMVAAEERHGEPRSLTELPLTRMLELLKQKAISPSELIKAHIARIQELHPKINAITFLDDARALKTAEKLDRALVRGSVDWNTQFLFAIPFSVKNAMDVVGVPTVCGAPAFKDNIAKEDAYYVKRYRDAGAIFLAATNMPFLSLYLESVNSAYGRTNNPHDLARTPGGSCGGEAALISSGGTPTGIATDYGGSVRVPAHWNGLFGLCPAARGQNWKGFPDTPDEGHPGPPYACVGTMARSVSDLERVKAIFVDPARRPPPASALADPRAINLADFRIMYFTHYTRASRMEGVTADVKKAVVLAAKALEQAGAEVTEELPEFLEQTYDIADSFALSAYDPTLLRESVKRLGAEHDDTLRRFIEMMDEVAAEYPPALRKKLIAAYPSWLENYRQLMAEYDAIILPVSGTPAPLHGETTTRLIGNNLTSFNFIAKMTDSAVSGTAPVLRSPEGLPIGVGVVGGPFAEDKLLRILYELESAFGGHIRPYL
jgi:amidase